MGATVFYLASTALALYALWLLVFRTYLTDSNSKPTDERVACPNIVYIILFAVSFIPVLNAIFFAVFVGMSLFGMHVMGDFYIKSWLLEKPKQKEKENP